MIITLYRIFKLYKLDGVNIHFTKDVGWVNNDVRRDDSYTIAIEDKELDCIPIPIKFTCNTSCQLDILPQKFQAFKHFNLKIDFLKFENGCLKIINNCVRKIYVGDDPCENQKADQAAITSWSDSIKTKYENLDANENNISLNMKLEINVPKAAALLTGRYMETLMEDTKIMVQNIANAIIEKDIQKAIRHKNIMADEYADRNKELKKLNKARESDISDLKNKCKKIEDELSYLRSRFIQ